MFLWTTLQANYGTAGNQTEEEKQGQKSQTTERDGSEGRSGSVGVHEIVSKFEEAIGFKFLVAFKDVCEEAQQHKDEMRNVLNMKMLLNS